MISSVTIESKFANALLLRKRGVGAKVVLRVALDKLSIFDQVARGRGDGQDGAFVWARKAVGTGRAIVSAKRRLVFAHFTYVTHLSDERLFCARLAS